MHHNSFSLALLPVTSLLLPACVLREVEAIRAKYDTYGEVSSSGEPDTDAADSSTTSTTDIDTSTSTTDAPDTTTTGGAEAGMDASGDASSSDSSSTTGPALAFCGDGIVDPDETCDDMNDDPDDGCKLCTRDRIVFVSSEEYQGFAIGGLFLADQRCRMLAAIAKLPNFATYRAWLSDSTTAAADRILHSKGRYVLVNGLVVADDWDELISGTLKSPINATESSQVPGGGTGVWTGTKANGQPAFGSSFCGDWNSDDDTQDGGSGLSDHLDEWWSFFFQLDCGSECSLYCFEN